MEDAGVVIERCHLAMAAFVRGDAEPVLQLFSRDDDVTLGNPFGPFVRGWGPVAEKATTAATHYRDGQVVGFERVESYEDRDLACFVEVERYRARIGASDELADVALRVTTVVRREGDTWRIVSRHADPIAALRSAESVIQPAAARG
jgi:ketosteroid isomerase-like protein